MGIGLKEFLRLSRAAVGRLVNPFQSIVVKDDIYLNRKLGILFQKPAGWGFIHLKDFGKLRSKQVIGNRIDDTDEIWETLGDPVCIATKYYIDSPETFGLFSPTITLHVTPKKELLPLGFEGIKDVMGASQLGTAKLLKDFRVLKQYDPYVISGVEFYEADAEYIFEHVELSEPLKVELKTLSAEHGDYYYDFNCHQSTEGNERADEAFLEFRNSIRLL